jgi:hypothetical protein
VYTPALNYNGPDLIAFKVTDNGSQVTPGTVQITVTPVNDPPVALGSNVTTTRTVPVAITLVGTDPDGEALTYNILTGPAHGTLSGLAPNLTYTPTGFYSGADALTFKVTDGAGAVSSNTVRITVNAGGALATTMTAAPATVTKPLVLQYTYNNLTGTLKTNSGNLPVSGVTIQFYAGGSLICSAATNASGVATCSGKGPRANAPTYRAAWAGNSSYAASFADGTLS